MLTLHQPGTALDREARLRATTVYLVQKAVPMLPQLLSETLCSLTPGKDKLTFSVVFNLNADGTIISTWFGKTVIKCVSLLCTSRPDTLAARPSSWHTQMRRRSSTRATSPRPRSRRRSLATLSRATSCSWLCVTPTPRHSADLWRCRASLDRFAPVDSIAAHCASTASRSRLASTRTVYPTIAARLSARRPMS